MYQSWAERCVWPHQLSGHPPVVIQQATEPRTPLDHALGSLRRPPIDKAILESLVIPLAMVVIDKLFAGPSEKLLVQGYHPIEALTAVRT